jgi:hypothetical protein
LDRLYRGPVLSSPALTVAGLLTSVAVAFGATTGHSPDHGEHADHAGQVTQTARVAQAT